MRVITTGNLCKDRAVYLDAYPVEDEKARFYDFIENAGGPAATAAAVIASFSKGFVPFVGAVGDDYTGIFCKEKLEKCLVNVDNVKTIPNYRTPDSDIFVVNEPGKASTRTILGWRDEKDKIGPPNLGEVTITGEFDGILSDGQYHQATADLIAEHPEATSVLDAGRATKDIMALCQKVDYVICSKQFAQDVTKTKIDTKKFSNLDSVYCNLFSDLSLEENQNLVITLGNSGSYVGNKILIDSYNDDINTIDTTGAGDIYHGAFMYAILKYNNYEYATAFATVVAALATTKRGGIPSIPSLSQVENLCTPQLVKRLIKNI